MNKQKTTLLVLTLNEIEAIQVIMPRVKQEWLDQIIFVDGGSTDGTVEWAREQGYEVWVQKAPGFRNAPLEVWPQIRGDIVITFSPDGNSIPEVIPSLVKKIEEGHDLVIASRYLGEARSADDDLVTGFGNWLFRVLTNLFLRPPGSPRITDIMVMYRAFQKNLPSWLGLDQHKPYEGLEHFFKTHVDWTPLMSMRALKYGIRWTEIPADEPPRIGGERKLQVWKWGTIFLIQLLSEACKCRQNVKNRVDSPVS